VVGNGVNNVKLRSRICLNNNSSWSSISPTAVTVEDQSMTYTDGQKSMRQDATYKTGARFTKNLKIYLKIILSPVVRLS